MEIDRRPLTETERLDWLRLIRSENIGSKTFFRLLGHFGSAEQALAGVPGLAARGGRKRPIRLAAEEHAQAEIEALRDMQARLVAWCEPDYPEYLAAIPDPPPVIAVRGDPAMLHRRCVAIVGARNASAAGRRFARQLAADLGEAGFVVVSGLARGIDTAAHDGALASGTVAVMAGGLDSVYPPENSALFADIVDRGAAVSEQPPGTVPTAGHFPPRNRLISGLLLGVAVVEAAQRSGSLITSRMALEQGREVFAVPGSPLDPRARGPNELIRGGATLIQSAADVIESLSGPFAPRKPDLGLLDFGDSGPVTPDDSALNEARRELIEQLGATPVTVDELARECQLPAKVVLTVLLEFELAGRVERHPGNRVSRAS
jgi:DNA processing protein